MSVLLDRLVRWQSPLLLVAIVVLTSVVGSWIFPSSIDYAIVTALVLLVVVIGLFTFTGNSGVFSFGHIALMAVGAYTAALLSVPADRKEVLFPEMPSFLAQTTVSPVLAVLIGGVVAALVAAAFAVPLMRLAGLTAALGTFAMLFIVYDVAANWEAVTNGGSGIGAIPTVTSQGAAIVWAILAIMLAWGFQLSRNGLRLRASREDEQASEASGVNVARERGVAFVLSGFIVGIGGGLYAQHIGTITPEAFYLQLTFLTLAMLVIGGIGTLSGAVVGVVVVTALQQALEQVEIAIDKPGLREVGLALAMLAMLLARPRGLTGGRELTFPRSLLGRAPDPAAAAEASSAAADGAETPPRVADSSSPAGDPSER